MAKFTVFEVQEETRLVTWRYEIEAEDEDEALELVQDGNVEAEYCDKIGDGDYGASGWAVRPGGRDEAEEAWDEAQEDMLRNL